MSPKQKGAGGKLKRSEVVTVRLDPKLRYGVELAARKHRRTASSFIEWAVELALGKVIVRDDPKDGMKSTMLDVLNKVWDVDEPERLVKLAFHFPELLNHEEQVLWKFICEYDYVWIGKWVSSGNVKYFDWTISEGSLIPKTLRGRWDTIKAVVDGTEDQSVLPNHKPEPDTSQEDK